MRALTLGLLGAGLLLLPIAVVSPQPGAPVLQEATPAPVVEVIQDREDGMYHVGEPAGFAVRLLAGDQPQAGTVSYTLTNDGVQPPLASGEIAVGAEPGVITGTLEAPGILRCTAWVIAGGQRCQGLAGAAFDPERIQPTAVVPDDFDEYWGAQKALLAAVPMDARLEQREAEGIGGLFKVSLANIEGKRVHGWLAVPAGGGPAPGLMMFSAAGVSGIGPEGAIDGAGRGFVTMHMIHHDFDVELPKEEADLLKAGALNGYQLLGRESRDTYYFRAVFLGCVRAIDLVTSRPEWDGEHLICTGSSQGGGLSLCIAGLDQRVTALAANVPALCDHTGLQQGRASGWPRLIPADDPFGVVATQVAPYFDAVNFARRFTGASWVTAGLVDSTCPATSVYSAYNVLPQPKRMIAYPRMGHAVPPEYSTDRWKFIMEQAGLN